MRPLINKDEEGEMIVQKVSNESLSINGHAFTFDSVADAEATQLDIFQRVGAPLVENCLAGFNSSVFAYGQTGSGKTYTMWGPANALLEGNLANDQQGLTPRVFERLFSRINEEQIKHAGRQLKYQCRCSFLEIYNEQITDLLDPRQKNLQIREDTKTGVYVENLTEECVSTLKDVIQLLLKGLANRRTGATSINAESSRSHSVFTCVVESHCKNLSDGLSSFKSSRINLVDLAGSERQRLTGAAGERLKEAGNINRSLSQLGNLINILAEISQTGKQRHIPYRDSRLTFLLQESLGGNAKLAMICAISPAQSCKSETFSTLRFAQRAKDIKNKAVVNEVMQDDVHFLREVIKQLKDELIRMKAHGNQTDPNAAYANSWSARRSINLLKFSLNHPMALHHIDDDGDEVMEIDEEAVQNLCDEVGQRIDREVSRSPMGFVSENKCIQKQASGVSDVSMEEGMTEIEGDNKKENTEEAVDEVQCKEIGDDSLALVSYSNSESSNSTTPNINLVPCDVSPVEKSPVPSISPRIVSTGRKSLSSLSKLTSSPKDVESFGHGKVYTHASYSTTHQSCFLGNRGRTTERLAASLHHGLEILENNRWSPPFRRSTFKFSFKPVDLKPKVDVGIQTSAENTELPEEEGVIYLCSNCKNNTAIPSDLKEANDTSSLQLVPVDTCLSAEKPKKQVSKAVEKVLAGAIRREMALEDFCAKQASEIAQLNRLVQQYKHERECNTIIGQLREDKIIRLENLMDGVLPSEDFMEDELSTLRQEHELLKEKYENHPDVLRTRIELKRVQDELERLRSFFDMGERDILVEEVQDLRKQLQYYTDTSPKSAKQRKSLLKLTYTGEKSSSPPLNTIVESTMEQQRAQYEEAESKWISLMEELKAEVESSRSISEQLKRELEAEKECSDELKEAMQLAMQGHARMLEQYADLEEKHMQMLANQRRFHEGVDDIKKAASRAGVKGAESRFINALAAEISALRMEREKERRYWRDENRMLQAQLSDTAEAVQAAGELLVRLKEAEEAVVAAEMRAAMAEEAAENSHKQADRLKKKHKMEINALNQVLVESRLPNEALKDDAEERHVAGNGSWKDEVEGFDVDDELSLKFAEPSSWFSGYDKCNI